MAKAELNIRKAEKAYERTVEKKRCIWQEKGTECIKLVRKKLKKIWEALRNITRRKEPIIYAGPHEWASYFHELFSISKDRILESLYDIQTLGPSYIAEIDSDFQRLK
jgi:ribosome recycling factor